MDLSVSAQSLFRIVFSIYLFVIRLKKMLYILIQQEQKALSVMISTGKNLVLWIFTYLNVCCFLFCLLVFVLFCFFCFLLLLLFLFCFYFVFCCCCFCFVLVFFVLFCFCFVFCCLFVVDFCFVFCFVFLLLLFCFCICFCIVVRHIFPRKASTDGKTSCLFCEPQTKIICICMCNAH